MGVQALDDATLQLTFKEPAAYNASIAGMWTGYAEPQKLNALALSPLTLRRTIIEGIEREVAFAQAGKPAQIWFKMNSIC